MKHSKLTQSTVNLLNPVIIVIISVEVWPHFSLSARKHGKLTKENSCCYPRFFTKKCDFSFADVCRLFSSKREAQKHQPIHDSSPECFAVLTLYFVYVFSPFLFSLTDVQTISNGLQSPFFTCVPFDWPLQKARKAHKSHSGFFDRYSQVLNDISKIIQPIQCYGWVCVRLHQACMMN